MLEFEKGILHILGHLNTPRALCGGAVWEGEVV